MTKNSMKKFVSALLSTIFVCTLGTSILRLEVSGQTRQKPTQTEKFQKSKNPISSRYIIVFNDENKVVANTFGQESVASMARSLTQNYGGNVDRVYSHALKGFSVKMTEKQALSLSQNARVKYVVEDGLTYLSATQYNAPWGLDRIDQRNRPLNSIYNYSATGDGVTAYVIDSGVLPWHVEFGGRASIGADFIGDGRNGVDCNGHGTHVSGTIAGNTYGVAKQASIVAVRVFGCSSSTANSTIIAAVDWVQANRVLPAVANMSLGGGTNQAIDDAVRNLIASGVTVVVAAGNGGSDGIGDDANGGSPGRVREAITVGATDINDNRAVFSNYGSALDVFAPGVNITSAWYTSDTATANLSGTSMATPHVAGVVAKYLSDSPSSSPAQIESVLTSNSTAGVVNNPGFGSPNILLASEIANACGTLLAGQSLSQEQSVSSCNGAIRFILQSDGNVVLYNNSGQALWASDTWGRYDATSLRMQSDGNLVLYTDDGTPIWSSGTWNNPGAYLAIQDDSNVVIYTAGGQPIWSTNTWGQ